MIPFIARQYYRLQQGSGVIGLPMNSVLWLAAQYGIYRAFLQEWGVNLLLFLLIGLPVWVGVYWGAGFLADRYGLFREYQSHMNKENNPEWRDAYDKIIKISEKLGVK